MSENTAPIESLQDNRQDNAVQPVARSPVSFVGSLLSESRERRAPLCVVVEELSDLSLVDMRECAEAWKTADEHHVVPFSHRGATLDKILRDTAERLRLQKKYSLAGVLCQPALVAIYELCQAREDDRVILVIQQADRLPIDTFKHLASALSQLDPEAEIGAHFLLGVSEGFFESRRGTLLLKALGGERIVSNVVFYESEQVSQGRVERTVPHPTDTLYVTPDRVDATDVQPEIETPETSVEVYADPKGRESPVLNTDPILELTDDYAEIAPRTKAVDSAEQPEPRSLWRAMFGNRTSPR